MLRKTMVVFAIVLFSEAPGFPQAHLPEAAAMVAVAEVIAFAVITFAAASVVFAVTALAFTVTALAVRITDCLGTGAAMCGATGAPTMGP